MTHSQSSSASRRGVLKGGALSLGSVAGAFALSGVSAQAAEAGMVPAQAGLSPGAVAAPAIGGRADYFLEIDGIKGESVDDGHRDWIDLFSFSWGASGGSTAVAGAGASSARSTISPLNVSMGLSAASPLLFLATMQGRRIASAVLEGVTAGESPSRFLELRMADVVVSSYASSAGGEAPTDSASLTFSKITYTYWQQRPDGSVGAETKVTWDVVSGRSF